MEQSDGQCESTGSASDADVVVCVNTNSEGGLTGRVSVIVERICLRLTATG
jgi:hypothetical protein